MQLTSSQIETFRKIEKGLLDRQIILLTGKSDGKSTIVQHAVQTYSGLSSPTRGDIAFCLPVFFPVSHRSTPQQLMRQVLQGVGINPAPGIRNTVNAFENLLYLLSKNSLVGCIAIDEFALSRQSFEAIKLINSYTTVSTSTCFGLAVLMSLRGKALERMPLGFRQRCLEVQLQRFTKKDVIQVCKKLIDTKLGLPSEEAIDTLTRCDSLLEVSNIICKALQDSQDLRLGHIDQTLIESTIQTSIRLRAAA